MKPDRNNEKKLDDKHRRQLRERLIAGYQANAEVDVLMAEEWRPIEEEVWLKLSYEESPD